MGKYKYGKKSKQVLSEVHYELQWLAREMLAMEIMDIAAICGRRGKEAQEKAFAEGNSKAGWGDSLHNVEDPVLSDAIDLAPVVNGVIPWEETHKDYPLWYIMGGMALAAAKKLSLNIKWGYYFKIGKGDLGHFERIREN